MFVMDVAGDCSALLKNEPPDEEGGDEKESPLVNVSAWQPSPMSTSSSEMSLVATGKPGRDRLAGASSAYPWGTGASEKVIEGMVAACCKL